jgi:hypothetical protein
MSFGRSNWSCVNRLDQVSRRFIQEPKNARRTGSRIAAALSPIHRNRAVHQAIAGEESLPFAGAAVRISFGEAHQGETTYFSAHQMSFADAVELDDVLGRVLSTKEGSRAS